MDQQIHVVYSVLAYFLSSNIYVMGKQMFVLQGETVTLPCNITWGMPPSWSRPGNVTLQEDVYTSGYNINPDLENFDRIALNTNKTLGTFDLVIKQFSFEDEGVYVCSSVMSEGMIKDENISVYIKKPPTNMTIAKSGMNNLVFGFANQPLNIACSVTSGAPKERMLWLKGNDTVTTGGPAVLTYSFIPKQSDHNRTLTCRAYNNVTDVPIEKSVSLFIYNTPTAHIRQGPAINVTEGDGLSLYCNVSSNYENTTVNWKLANSKGRDFVISNLSSNQYYKSENMSRTGAGLYICMVTSLAGSAEDNITIEVQYAPAISFNYSMSEGLLRCVTYGVPSQYTFYKWEHKSEFGDHIRSISDDGNGQINIPSDLNETNRHHDRGIYVCRVSNGVSVNGKRVQSSEYVITPEGKPYFTTTNNANKQSVFNHNEKIKIYVVSVPKMSKISIFNPDLSVDVIDHKQLDLTRIKDTMYGKIVSVKGYIISFPVTTRSDFQWYTVEVTNSIGSNNYTVYFSFAEGKLTHAAVYIIPILLIGLMFILLAMLYYRWKKGNDIGRQIASFVRRLQLPPCGNAGDEDGIGGIENDFYELQNNIAPSTSRNDSDDQVYSSIDRRRHLNIGQTVSYSVVKNKKTKASAQKENESVARKKSGKPKKSTDTSTINAATGQDVPQLNYIDICFDPKPKEFKYKIHGYENKTEYVEIDFDKTSEMKPVEYSDDGESDDDFVSADDVKQMKRKTQFEPSPFNDI